MLNKHQKFGKKSESEAVEHLVKNGYRILEQNFRTKVGEIDIIAKDGDTIVFVEVKARRSDCFGNPKFAITSKKRQKISMAALYYLKAKQQSNAKARFDVVTIRSGKENSVIEIIKNAFELAYHS